jgi:hypothetical protein
MEDVLVLMHGILFELQRTQLWEEEVGYPRRVRQLQRLAGRLPHQQTRQLVADAFGGHGLDQVA